MSAIAPWGKGNKKTDCMMTGIFDVHMRVGDSTQRRVEWNLDSWTELCQKPLSVFITSLYLHHKDRDHHEAHL